MAVTIDKIAASQNMLRYGVSADGAGTNDTTLTKAALIADCVAGALRSKLDGSGYGTDVSGIVAWDEIELDPEISVYTAGKNLAPVLLGFAFVNNGSANAIQVRAAAAGDAILEIRFNPTPIT